MNRADLQQLAELRITEAKVLLDNGFYAGAYYLAGYAVECALKACIAKLTNQYDFPDKEVATKSYTHKFAELVKVARLETQLDNASQDKDFEINWSIVKEWKPESRYSPNILGPTAQDFYNSITDAKNGVLPWLRRYW
jgi:HEPN domain-containing protein